MLFNCFSHLPWLSWFTDCVKIPRCTESLQSVKRHSFRKGCEKACLGFVWPFRIQNVWRHWFHSCAKFCLKKNSTSGTTGLDATDVNFFFFFILLLHGDLTWQYLRQHEYRSMKLSLYYSLWSYPLPSQYSPADSTVHPSTLLLYFSQSKKFLWQLLFHFLSKRHFLFKWLIICRLLQQLWWRILFFFYESACKLFRTCAALTLACIT